MVIWNCHDLAIGAAAPCIANRRPQQALRRADSANQFRLGPHRPAQQAVAAAVGEHAPDGSYPRTFGTAPEAAGSVARRRPLAGSTKARPQSPLAESAGIASNRSSQLRKTLPANGFSPLTVEGISRRRSRPLARRSNRSRVPPYGETMSIPSSPSGQAARLQSNGVANTC